jgi:hypothetical protein
VHTALTGIKKRDSRGHLDVWPFTVGLKGNRKIRPAAHAGGGQSVHVQCAAATAANAAAGTESPFIFSGRDCALSWIKNTADKKRGAKQKCDQSGCWLLVIVSPHPHTHTHTLVKYTTPE